MFGDLWSDRGLWPTLRSGCAPDYSAKYSPEQNVKQPKYQDYYCPSTLTMIGNNFCTKGRQIWIRRVNIVMDGIVYHLQASWWHLGIFTELLPRICN